jgi:two-component sensor histidine kinase
VGEDALRAHLAEASGRVSAIGRAYERLTYDADIENIDLGPYLQEVCADAIRGFSHCKLDFNAVGGVQLNTDRAISLALIINELVTNAVKHGLADRPDVHIWVRFGRSDEKTVLITVRDNGVGLPAGFELGKATGLGMRIVARLSEQLQAAISYRGGADGTVFTLSVPL